MSHTVIRGGLSHGHSKLCEAWTCGFWDVIWEHILWLQYFTAIPERWSKWWYMIHWRAHNSSEQCNHRHQTPPWYCTMPYSPLPGWSLELCRSVGQSNQQCIMPTVATVIGKGQFSMDRPTDWLQYSAPYQGGVNTSLISPIQSTTATSCGRCCYYPALQHYSQLGWVSQKAINFRFDGWVFYMLEATSIALL